GEAHERPAGRHLDAELLAQLARQGRVLALAGGHLAAREFPAARQGLAGGTLRDQHPAAAIVERRRDHQDEGLSDVGPRRGARRGGARGGAHAGSDRGLLLGGGEERSGLGVLRLQRAHEAAAALFLLAVDFLLGAHFDLRHQRGGLELDPIEHGREQLEGFALELEAVVLLCVAAQVNALAQVVHGRSEEHTSELQSLAYLVCRLLLEKKKKKTIYIR